MQNPTADKEAYRMLLSGELRFVLDYWPSARKIFKKPKFLKKLGALNVEHVPEENIELLLQMMDEPAFQPEEARKTTYAAQVYSY